MPPADRPDPVPTTALSVHVALACAAVALVVGAAALAAPWVAALAVAVAGVVLAWGWAGTLGLPSPRGTVGVLVVGSLSLAAAVARPESAPWLGWVPAALSLAMIAAFVHQLLRVDGRPRVVESVSAVVLALALVACGSALVASSRTAEGLALVLAVLAAAAASSFTDVLGRVRVLTPWLLPLAMLAGGAASVAVAYVLDAPWTVWLAVGVAAGAVSHAARAVLAPLPTLVHARPRLTAAVASVLAVGALPYLFAWAFLGAALPAG